jgi:hypothetical protein
MLSIDDEDERLRHYLKSGNGENNRFRKATAVQSETY